LKPTRLLFCRLFFPILFFLAAGVIPLFPQAVPHARSFAKPRTEVEQALEDLQAYSGQKLPTLDGFVAMGDKPLDRYERGFYQFSIELVPGDAGATVVRLTAKITAWYADRDVTKSGYQVLPSNGRLELDFLDRLEEKLTGKPVASPSSAGVQTPRPNLDLSGARSAAIMAAPLPQRDQPPDEVAALRSQRIASEKRVQQLTDELRNLQEIRRSQAHPQNLVTVKNPGTPVYAKNSEDSRLLFQATANDEFEFLEAENGWIHISISGDSRGYVRANAVELPDRVAARIQSHSSGIEERFPGFRIVREEASVFPGDWAPLKGKQVKLYTVQLLSSNLKETGPAARLNFCIGLFEKALHATPSANSAAEGIAVIFDAADGGIVGATLADIQKLSAGSLSRETFWQRGYFDPPEAFKPAEK